MRAVAVLLLCALLPGSALAAGDGGGAMDLFWRVLNLGLLLAVLFVFARKPIQGFFRDRRPPI